MYRDRIRSSYESFSPGYRRIANYLLAHYQDAAFMTATEIARAAQVDAALVVRFAQRLGYPGFPELIAEVQQAVKRDLRAVYEPPEGGDTPEQILRRNLCQDRNNLDYMLHHLDEAAIGQTVRQLNAARRVFLIGEGNTSYLAEAFAMRLLTLGYTVNVMSNEFTGQAAITANLMPDDLIMGLSTTGLSPVVATVLNAAREQRAQTIAIVSSLTSPAAAAADLALHAPVDTVGILPSWSSMAALLHALTQALALTRDDRGADWALRTDNLLKMYWATLRAARTSDVRQALIDYNVAADEPSLAGGAPAEYR